MKTLYFDYNIINYLRQKEPKYQNLISKFDEISSLVDVCFSSAHLEEIAVSQMRYSTDNKIIDEEINFLTQIAGNNSLRPITRHKLERYNEFPMDCYERVISLYELNDIAENIDKHVISDAHKNPFGNAKKMSNEKPEDILTKFQYKQLIILALLQSGLIEKAQLGMALNWSFSDIKDKFYIFEAYVNVSANLLEKLGFFRESEKKARSRLHDVSHIIYGAYTDIFVTEDKRLLNKTKAIYHALQVPTEVLNIEDFCKYKFS